MPDEPIDYNALVSETAAEMGVDLQGNPLEATPADQPNAEESEGNETAQEESTTEEPTVEIDGETFSLSEAKELLSKGKDYTKKTQTLAQEREQQKAYIELGRMWDQHPEMRPAILKELQGQVAMPEPETEPEDFEMWSEGEQAVYRENQQLKQQISEVSAFMHDMKRYMADQQLSSRAQTLAAQMSATYGIPVSDQEIRAAMRETQINDPEAAWLKVHHKKLLGVAKVAGIKEGSKTMPLAPKSATKTFTLDDVDGSIDGAMAKISAGYTLVD